MKFDPPLTLGRFQARRKRFFADVTLADGREVVAHCPNTGSMRGCLIPGARVALMPAADPKRKLRWTWVLVEIGSRWLGVDTGRAVPLVAHALQARGELELLPELAGYPRLDTEVRYGVDGRSRIDLLLSRGGEPCPLDTPAARRRKYRPFAGDERVYIEVKNTTLFETPGSRELGDASGRGTVAAFPDAVTLRGQKHLRELMAMVDAGHRAAMVYVVQRSGCEAFRPAWEIDPDYAELLRAAFEHGVEVYALGSSVGPSQMRCDRRLELRWP